MPNRSIIIALDGLDDSALWPLIEQLDAKKCRLKVGKELFTRYGPPLVDQLQRRGFDIFLDLKFHDIPNTVARAVTAAADLGVWMLNVHATGGEKMLRAAKAALVPFNAHAPLLIAVTLLTHLKHTDLAAIGIQTTLPQQVKRLALLAQACGLAGVVCSAQEATALRKVCGRAFKLVTPGIRPVGSAVDDQKRTMTPVQAVAAGADYLVIGRPITQADDPPAAFRTLYRTLIESDAPVVQSVE